VDAPLPDETLGDLVREIQGVIKDPDRTEKFSPTELEHFREAHRMLTKEGNNEYLRLVGPPEVFSRDNVKILCVPIAPSRYGIALVEERRFVLPTAVKLRQTRILNSLGVRVAVIYPKDGVEWVEFHQRRGKTNSLYKEAWDVGAAGYIDLERHKDTEPPNCISVWRASALEIEEELNIPQWELQFREHYRYFGVGRNDLTGQVDVLGVCRLANSPDPNRKVKSRVTRYDRCLLEPEPVADFVCEQKYWVPSALLTLILLLQAEGFTSSRIEAAFARCAGNVDLDP